MVGGGAPVVIWHKALGLVAAGTMAKFYWIEAHNMQGQRRDLETRSLTPRIEGVAADGRFSNVCDAGVAVKAGMQGGAFVAETSGNLIAWDPTELNTNGTYRITYRVTRKTFALETWADVPYRLVFPLRSGLVDGLSVSASSLGQVESTAREGDAFSTIGGFLMRYQTYLPDDHGRCAVIIGRRGNPIPSRP